MQMKTRYKQAATLILALLMLSSCTKPTNSGGAAQSPPSSETGISVKESAPKPDYEVIALTEEGIAVETGGAYYLPLGEGKYVPADDEVWRDHLDGQEWGALESLSMPFVAVDRGETALVYVMENPYRAMVRVTGDPDIRLELVAEESTLDPASENNVRIYTTENSAVAGAYRSYLDETREVLTLAEKAEQNPNVAKLFGAPHIYLWGNFLLSEKDINWQAFIAATDSPVLAHVSRILADTEGGGEFPDTLRAISGQNYVDEYQRNTLLNGLSTALMQENFYDGAVLANSNDTIKNLLAKGETKLDAVERIVLHKHALYENLPGVFEPVDKWYDYATVDVLNEMKAAGIDTAWIGLDSVMQAYRTPRLGETAT